jgi:hypothetical protein
VLGGVNTAGAATTIRTTEATAGARSIVGEVLHTGAGGNTAGVQGRSEAQNGSGVEGIALRGAGARGVSGRSAAGAGVYGEAVSPTAANAGVKGVTASTAGAGVFGEATSPTGKTYGVRGLAASPDGIGVYGKSAGSSGQRIGVMGETDSPSGHAVHGQAAAGIGVYGAAFYGIGYGVFGYNVSGTGVKGFTASTTGTVSAVNGETVSVSGRGVLGLATNASGTNFGVDGRSYSTGGRGVYGGAWATSGSNIGVMGASLSPVGRGVYGDAPTYAVWGSAWQTSGFTIGVIGQSKSTSGRGVYGSHLATSGTGYGVLGETSSPAGYGGFFRGRVHVTGVLTKGGGGFLIDHPVEPADRYLEHSFVEAPERLNVYRGLVTLDARGSATVRLPRYNRALNTDFGYQLTPIGGPAPGLHVARELSGSSFRIAGGDPGQKVCWQLSASRQDAWAKANPLRVDRPKRARDRGKYLHPEVFGAPRSVAIHAMPRLPRNPRRMSSPRLGGLTTPL